MFCFCQYYTKFQAYKDINLYVRRLKTLCIIGENEFEEGQNTKSVFLYRFYMRMKKFLSFL